MALFFSSCLSPVDLNTESIGGRIVLSGQISTMADQNIVELGTTADTERLPFPVSGATVIAIDDNTTDSIRYTEDSSQPGTYKAFEFSALPGHTYHVAATLPDGRIYLSNAETMPDQSGTIETSYEIAYEQFTDSEGTVSYQPFIKIRAAGTLPQGSRPSFLKWGVEEAFLLSPTDFPDTFGNIPPPCFIVQNADPQRIVLFNGEIIGGKSFSDLLIMSRVIDWTFWEKHYFTSYQASITEDAFKYWTKVNILANQVGSIFDTPPAEITGNIYASANPEEKVYGYFQVANHVFNRFAIFRNDLPFTLTTTNCDYSSERNDYPTRCLDCISVRNSTFERPAWF